MRRDAGLDTASTSESCLIQLMTPAEVSEYLSVPAGTLANWRYQGHGPRYLRVGRHIRYLADDVHDWVLTQASSRDERTRTG